MNEKRQIYALPLGQTDVRIECEGTSTEITGWTITDNNGDRYIYRQKKYVQMLSMWMFPLPMLFQIPVIPRVASYLYSSIQWGSDWFPL